MCPFVETIRIEQGRACRLSYHNERLNATRRHFGAGCNPIRLEEHLHLSPGMDGMKCRVVYDVAGIRDITYTPYTVRQVHSLRLVCDDGIDYTYKSTDREALNRLFALRGEQDDVLIVRRGLLTDTSIANIALWDGTGWHTPRSPLLKGTHRAALLDEGIVRERDIPAEALPDYSSIRLFNAMIGWGVVEFPVASII